VYSFVGSFHDAVILYALALNETLEAGLNATNGTEVTRRMWNRTFEGYTDTTASAACFFILLQKKTNTITDSSITAFVV